MMRIFSGRRAFIVVPAAMLAGCSLISAPWTRQAPPPAPVVALEPPPAPALPVPLDTHKFTLMSADEDVVGEIQLTAASKEDTLPDIARRFNVGYEEIVRANPGVDPWIPGAGRMIVVPTRFVLPNAPRDGIIINVAAMRLYYFPPHKKGEPVVVFTHPIGVGKVGWSTPEGSTKITGRRQDPVWRPSAALRKDRRASGEDDVDATSARGGDRIEHDGGGIATLLRDDRDAVALAPDFELFTRGSAKSVACSQQHRIALYLEVLGKLAYGSRLAGAVDPGNHHHEGPFTADDQRLFEREQQLGEHGLEQCASVGIDLGAFGAGDELGKQMRRRGNADIGFEQRGFELFEGFVRKRPAPEHGAKRARETLTRKPQARFQSLAPGAAVGFGIAFEQIEHEVAR